MDVNIRDLKESDRNTVIDMMRAFYASDAVYTNGSEEIFSSDIDACLSDSPYLIGYVFEVENKIAGYAMLSKSFSTEFGKPCVWIEDIFVLPEFRGRGTGKYFFKFIETAFVGSIFRLEVEKENINAIDLYEKAGFDFLPYLEMKK